MSIIDPQIADEIEGRISVIIHYLMNEGGEGYNPYEFSVRKTDAELKAELSDRGLTLARTKQIRASWNEWVRSLPPDSKVSSKKVAEKAAEFGMLFADFKMAVKVWGLKKG